MDVLWSILLFCLLLLAYPESNYAIENSTVVFTIANGNDIQCNGILYFGNQLIVDQECSDEIYRELLISIHLKLPQTATTTSIANDQFIHQQPQATFTDSDGYMFHCNGFWIQNENIFIIDQNYFEEIQFRIFLIIELNLTSQQTFVIRLPEKVLIHPIIVPSYIINQGYSTTFRSIKFCSLTISFSTHHRNERNLNKKKQKSQHFHKSVF